MSVNHALRGNQLSLVGASVLNKVYLPIPTTKRQCKEYKYLCPLTFDITLLHVICYRKRDKLRPDGPQLARLQTLPMAHGSVGVCYKSGACYVSMYIYLINQARGPYWENIGPRS